MADRAHPNKGGSVPITADKKGDLYEIVADSAVDAGTRNNSFESELPANTQKQLSINWLGSSYSGADIKIVVHTYGEIDAGDEENILNEERNHLTFLIDAYNDISQYSFANWTDLTLSIYTGSNFPFDSSVKTEIRQFLASFAQPRLRHEGRDITLTRITSAASSNAILYGSERQGIDDRLAKLGETRKNSHSTFVLATAQTFSIQSHREKHAVRALGHTNAKGYTRGQRTIAGSIIFTMFNEHALAGLIRSMGKAVNKYDLSPAKENQISSLLIDQLPPIDITIVFANEYGSLSRAGVYGVEFMNSGITLSIEDLLTEEVVNFVARDMDPVISQGNISIDRNQRGMHFDDEGNNTTGTDLIFANKSSYTEYLNKLGVRRGLRNR